MHIVLCSKRFLAGNKNGSPHMSYMYANANASPPHTPACQTRAQVDACNSNVDNPNAEEPLRVNFCLGSVDSVNIILETSSEILPDSVVFRTGESYYYTSKS